MKRPNRFCVIYDCYISTLVYNGFVDWVFWGRSIALVFEKPSDLLSERIVNKNRRLYIVFCICQANLAALYRVSPPPTILMDDK